MTHTLIHKEPKIYFPALKNLVHSFNETQLVSVVEWLILPLYAAPYTMRDELALVLQQ